MADEKDAERRVYTLPPDILEGIRAYMAANGITSEAEAARRLLSRGLQVAEDVKDILKKLYHQHNSGKDLRTLASEVLSPHYLVENITINDDKLFFRLRNGEQGVIYVSGHLGAGEAGDREDQFASFEYPPVQRAKAGSSGGWDAGGRKGADLDDEIPF